MAEDDWDAFMNEQASKKKNMGGAAGGKGDHFGALFGEDAKAEDEDEESGSEEESDSEVDTHPPTHPTDATSARTCACSAVHPTVAAAHPSNLERETWHVVGSCGVACTLLPGVDRGGDH